MTEAESLNRICSACQWMYEFCAKHGMEDAKQGIMQTMEKQFNLPQFSDLVVEHMNEFQTVRRLIEAEKYEEAIEAFELTLDHVEGMDTSAAGLHGTVKNLLKVQAVLEPLRASPPKINQFKVAEKLLFPAGPVGRRAAGSVKADLEAQRVETRDKLEKVAKSPTEGNINKLLKMFPMDDFLKTADEYFKDALTRFQKPTFLENVMDDIESGKYVPSKPIEKAPAAPVPKARPSGIDFKDQKAAQEAAKQDVPSEPAAKRRGRSAHTPEDEPSSTPPANKKGKKAESEEPQTEAGQSSSAQSPASAKKKGKGAQKAADKEALAPSSSLAGKKRKGVMASAWEIRESLDMVDGTGNEVDWQDVHQAADEEVIELKKQIERGDARKSKRQKMQATHVPASKRRGAKAEEEDEEEEDSDDEVTQTPVAQKKKKRAGKENAVPVDNDTDEGVVTRQSPSNEVVRNLRDKSSILIKQGNDPLQESVLLASSLAPPASSSASGGSKPKTLLERAGEGKQVKAFSDDEDEDAPKLPKLQNNGFQPKSRLSVDKAPPKAASKSGHAWGPNKSERIRWTDDEEQELMDGVKAYGEGNWKNIWEEYKFNNRTPVDLKDKWRNLKRAGRV